MSEYVGTIVSRCIKSTTHKNTKLPWMQVCDATNPDKTKTTSKCADLDESSRQRPAQTLDLSMPRACNIF